MDFLTPSLNTLLQGFLDEDFGRGDLTRSALNSCNASAYWVTKQPGIFCGGPLVERLFYLLDPSVKIKVLVPDGTVINSGQKLVLFEGPAASLVGGERTALNLAMRLSGIATFTANLVKNLEGTGAHLADTRKTTPGLRIFEKYAFRCGGGVNHRFGLDDAAMLKENHLSCVESIDLAVFSLRKSLPWPARVIVEVETPEQAETAVRAGVDGLLLDEFPVSSLENLVPHLRQLSLLEGDPQKPSRVVLEASGIDVKNLRAYAKTGIDLISTSAPFTKSPWLDFSMLFDQAG